MKPIYKIRIRKDTKGNPFYQLTIPKEWIEQTRATEIQFKNGDGNQLIIDPVTFSGEIPLERPKGRRFQLRPDRTIEERLEDLFFGDDDEEQEDKNEGDLENLDLIDKVNKKFKR